MGKRFAAAGARYADTPANGRCERRLEGLHAPAAEAASGAAGQKHPAPGGDRRPTSAQPRRSQGHKSPPAPFYEPEGRDAVGLHMTDPSDFMIDPPLRVRGRPDLAIDSLDGVTAFIRPYDPKAGTRSRGVCSSGWKEPHIQTKPGTPPMRSDGGSRITGEHPPLAFPSRAS